MKLVIVESPKKCETIRGYLGKDYEVMASKGHICDLSTRGKGGLGIDIENGFKPSWIIDSDKYETVNKLKAAAKKADEVILATDPDREGEAISWHLADVLGLDMKTTKRLEFHEITKPAILEAMEHPRTIDMNLVEAQNARRMYDRIIGFNLSSLLNKKIGSPSAGRVQSATLRMIVDNDDERKAFKPEPYWVIELTLNIGGKKAVATLSKVDGKAMTRVKTEEKAKEILDRIGDSLTVVSVKKSKKNIEPKLPFTTSTMQQEAFAKFHFSTSKTQSIAQRLYEGKDINGEHVGLITYMRTDSPRISPNFFYKHAVPFITETYGEEYLGRMRSGKKSALAQDAHECIRPTGTHRTPEVVAKSPDVSAEEAKLYRLIYDRAMASVMAAKVVDVTTAVLEKNGIEFKVEGNKTIFDGYERIYGEFDEDETRIVPEMKEGEEASISKKKSEGKTTEPPSAYSEAKVVKLMEEKGIGRPSTYASTIKTLIDRKYVSSTGGILSPSESGIKTTKALKTYFPEIVSDAYTAQMEVTLDQIEKGEAVFLSTMQSFYTPFIARFKEVTATMPKDEDERTGDICPECGSPMVVKKGRFGQFIACSNYPTCKYVLREEKAAPKETGEACPECGKPLVERKDKKGRPFVACSGYPRCRYIKGNEERKKPTFNPDDYVKECPRCKTGHIVVKHGKKGKSDFYGCTNFPKCRYIEAIKK
ncbi:MAG: type I DNA topoisomerase [Bacilli bacterium]|nr:type I DNA topoisomerase [Bacilli bacterium]